ncbi:MAG: tripartite tricarboxylate transporter TctB family protein [Methylobacterium sp.]|uniref:tripartite tricarboxylate transporter TctB family protein n=1 Tax=Methylobacterium sp. TaxID=409 RepID=UPI0025EB9706|nr:tripartite tricarboxylate transporter TctB family protein [Methylobacterium sp.]MBX9933587.1 tripartite tricarboxylate transporter TctB family protein [Methylobacterium sp.]
MAHDLDRSENTVSKRTMELVVAGLFMALATLIMVDNWRLGALWQEDGPGAGYFPFRIGVIMFVVSAITFVIHLRRMSGGEATFVDRSQLRQVFQVLVPTIVFVVSIGFLGIYLASAIFILFFMRWLGKYPFYKILPIAVLTPLFLFVMFEIWFLVPLPKGPIEAALGY